jgi:hypothetical protein
MRRKALRWQNGLSLPGAAFSTPWDAWPQEARAHQALPACFRSRHQLLKTTKIRLLRARRRAAAYAFAAVLERIRYGTLPAGLAQESLRQQAASMAVALSAKPHNWHLFWAELQAAEDDPIDLVLRAIALGWKSKWT